MHSDLPELDIENTELVSEIEGRLDSELRIELQDRARHSQPRSSAPASGIDSGREGEREGEHNSDRSANRHSDAGGVGTAGTGADGEAASAKRYAHGYTHAYAHDIQVNLQGTHLSLALSRACMTLGNRCLALPHSTDTHLNDISSGSNTAYSSNAAATCGTDGDADAGRREGSEDSSTIGDIEGMRIDARLEKCVLDVSGMGESVIDLG